jgi:DNA polymerase-3 subunit epsilon
MSNIFSGSDLKGYAVVDLETTGLRSTDRIVEIGIVLLDVDGYITDVLETLIRPPIPMGASEIHGITEDMVRHSPTIENMSPQILAAFESRKLVAHNAHFEARFLTRELDHTGVSVNTNNFIDTLKLSRSFLKTRNHKLSTIADYYGISIDNPHQAISDAYATALVLQKLMKEKHIPGINFNAAPLYADDFENYPIDKKLWSPR